MITMKSPFVEFIELCRKHDACEDQGAFRWMAREIEKNKDITFGEAMKDYLVDETADASYSFWILEMAGKELDEEVRQGFIAKIKDPMTACQIFIKCGHVLTETEDILLKEKYEGKLPTAEKELRTGVICRTTVEVKPGVVDMEESAGVEKPKFKNAIRIGKGK